jgi:hypothetical protein
MYHIVNRGNYRRDVFESPGAAGTFVSALEEAQLEAELARTLHEYRAMFARGADQVGVHRDPVALRRQAEISDLFCLYS